ncbi:MAG TPA: methyltransferase domain-containing protein [Noviherbaspirillum sp.]|uniref:class I SAM-dependent methyltransferase n=1 Tax=Noviherbaspirillum sp. TaxID=1926288 RepID=UPI002B4A9AA7|nr:methyltransferase domain-containing protein [Noviherbaspirillum sp.]HJV85651.1 methyltransferase domain-containing protein [Noviherbaspirillum sp.]
MSFLREFAARYAHSWLERFRNRHGLSIPALQVTSHDGVFRRSATGKKLLLHVGCGHATIDHIGLSGFSRPTWSEIRLDADETVAPDIVGSMTEMPSVPSKSVDAVFSSHGIEHLYWHDVPRTLAEFFRVLRDDGFLVVACPDLQAAAQMISEDRMFDTAYMSAAGPITPFDMVFSYRPFVEANPQWMSHHCGFTLSTLLAALREASFASVYGIRRPDGFDLWVLGSKSPRTTEEIAALAAQYLPVVA